MRRTIRLVCFFLIYSAGLFAGENLSKSMGKYVVVVLRVGKSAKGTLKAVDQQFLYLATKHGEFPIPLRAVKEVLLVKEAPKKTPATPVDLTKLLNRKVKIVFSSGGEASGTLSDIEGATISLTSESGTVAVEKKFIKEYKLIKEAAPEKKIALAKPAAEAPLADPNAPEQIAEPPAPYAVGTGIGYFAFSSIPLKSVAENPALPLSYVFMLQMPPAKTPTLTLRFVFAQGITPDYDPDAQKGIKTTRFGAEVYVFLFRKWNVKFSSPLRLYSDKTTIFSQPSAAFITAAGSSYGISEFSADAFLANSGLAAKKTFSKRLTIAVGSGLAAGQGFLTFPGNIVDQIYFGGYADCTLQFFFSENIILEAIADFRYLRIIKGQRVNLPSGALIQLDSDSVLLRTDVKLVYAFNP